MADAKPGRKPNVPSIDRVIEFVLDGTYDGDLGRLRDSIDQRNKARQESVLELVHEVFGPDADVQVPPAPRNPFIDKAQSRSDEHEATESNDLLSDLDDVERQMSTSAPTTDFERRGAMISGLHSSDIRD